jgi:hypothetical protein
MHGVLLRPDRAGPIRRLLHIRLHVDLADRIRLRLRYFIEDVLEAFPKIRAGPLAPPFIGD